MLSGIQERLDKRWMLETAVLMLKWSRDGGLRADPFDISPSSPCHKPPHTILFPNSPISPLPLPLSLSLSLSSKIYFTTSSNSCYLRIPNPKNPFSLPKSPSPVHQSPTRPKHP
jgi:hypothetical protein